MTDNPEIETMAQASEAVNKAPKTMNATLADGTVVVIRKLSWLHFKELWGGVSKLIHMLTEMSNGADVNPEDVAEKMLVIPELAEKFLSATTDYSIEDIGKFDDYNDVLNLFIASISHNWPGAVLSFFSGVVAGGSGNAGANKAIV